MLEGDELDRDYPIRLNGICVGKKKILQTRMIWMKIHSEKEHKCSVAECEDIPKVLVENPCAMLYQNFYNIILVSI